MALALGLFLKTGVATPVVDLGEQMRRWEAQRALGANTRDFPRFGRLVQAIERFADDLATIRVASIITGYGDAQGSAAALLSAIEECREEIAQKLPPLALILDQLTESISPLSAHQLATPDGQQAKYALARRYLDLSRYPEAVAVVREAQVNRYAEDKRAVEVSSPDFDQTARSAAEKKLAEQDMNLLQEIADVRKDLEHAGFRKQPLPAKSLQKRVRQIVERFAPEGGSAGPAAPADESSCRRGETIFVSRHSGAVEWAARQGIRIDRMVEHLDLAEIRSGDTVIGTLPVHLAAEVCRRGSHYLHLALDLPSERRGVELTAEDMARCGARLVEYWLERMS